MLVIAARQVRPVRLAILCVCRSVLVEKKGPAFPLREKKVGSQDTRPLSSVAHVDNRPSVRCSLYYRHGGSDCVVPAGKQGTVTSNLITLAQGGYGHFASEENDDHNPDRVKPRSLFNLGIGTDNLLHREGRKRVTASHRDRQLNECCGAL